MATSGTYTFNMDVHAIIEKAHEKCGLELQTSEQLRSARTNLDLLLIRWINDGVNLWTMDQLEIPMTAGTQSYTLDTKYVDILDAVIRDSDNNDTSNYRISLSEYLNRPSKDDTGKPIQHTLERNSTGGHTLYVWPTASDSTSYTFVAWAIRYIEDAGEYTDNIDIPKRFLPALIYGLAYEVAMDNPLKVDPVLRAEIKQGYIEAFASARMEDRERASLFITPSAR